ncbi:MAG TPA: outer membrane protein assembly factor BamA [bacterium]|nr:outer membrane protein assembly factor BamA [bacterium]
MKNFFYYLTLAALILFAKEAIAENLRYINIKDIKISGNNLITEFEIRENLVLKEEKYEINKFYELLDQSTKILYSTNNFKNINFKIDETDTEIVYLILEEWPIFESVEFVGLNNVKSNKDDTETLDKINEMCDYNRGDFVNDYKTNRIAAKIKEFLVSEGYYYAEVKHQIVKVNEKKNRVKIVFDIFEGAEIKVKYVDIYSKEKLGNLKKTYMKFKANVDKGDVFKMQEFEMDVNKIKVGMWNEGHINSRVYTEFIDYKTENKIGINIYIEKGKKYKVKNFNVSGNTYFEKEKLLKLVKLQKNEYFSYDALMETIKGITDLYSEEGYIETRVEPDQKIVSENGVEFNFQITEGNKIYIEDIVVKGNYKTKKKVILREILVKPGEVLNSKKVDLSRRNLVMLNFFDKVDLKILDGKNPSNKILAFEVEEGRTGTVSFGAGYSSVDKFVGFVELTKNNFDASDFWSFTGKGQKVNMRIEYGKERKNYELGWSDPWFNDSLKYEDKPSPKNPLYLGYNLYRISRNPDDYEIQRTGGNIKIGRKLGLFNRIYVKYQMESVKITEVDSTAPTDIIDEVGGIGGHKQELQSSITFELNRNTTDAVRWPTKGYIATLTNEISGGFMGGDVDYIKTELDASVFVPLFNTKLGRQVLAFHFAGGSVDNIFGDEDVPSYEKYFLGGSSTIRGYGERDIKYYNITNGENYGGKTQLYYNLEYRIPLVKDTISSVIFYDGGNIDVSAWKMDMSGWRFGYGLGFRIDTPMGLLRLDWARRINETYPGKGDKGETEIHFNIGNMF